MDPAIGIKKDNLSKVAHVLNEFLADEFLLYLKTRNAHWNVEMIKHTEIPVLIFRDIEKE